MTYATQHGLQRERYAIRFSYGLCVNYLKPQELDHRIEIPIVMQ